MANLSRTLTDTQSTTLRSLLHTELKKANPQLASFSTTTTPTTTDDDDDASDLLDYALAMVVNGKSAEYIVSELLSVEMDICTSETAGRIGVGIGSFLDSMSGGKRPSTDQEEEPTTTTTIASPHIVNESVDAMAEKIEAMEEKNKKEWVNNHAVIDADGRARCSFHFCRKLFKDKNFLQKHLLKKHPEFLRR